MKRRPSFDWWNDAVEVARLAAAASGVRYRVHYIGGPRPWAVTPAPYLHLVEVTC